jgi:hypothetical protein
MGGGMNGPLMFPRGAGVDPHAFVRPLVHMSNAEMLQRNAERLGSRNGDPLQVMPARKWPMGYALLLMAVVSSVLWLGIIGGLQHV